MLWLHQCGAALLALSCPPGEQPIEADPIELTEFDRHVSHALMLPFPSPMMLQGAAAGGHRYWRVFISVNDGHGSATEIAEVEMHTAIGGADVCTGGTASGSGTGGTPANAFDNSSATVWSVGGTTNRWIAYDFGAGNPKNIVEFALTCGNVDAMAKTFQLEYSDDGSSWTLALGPYTHSLWITGETLTFPQTAPAAGFHKMWRLMCLTQNGGTSQFRINEIEFRATAGGADQCVNVGDTGSTTAGRIIRTSGDGGAFGNAFDNTFDDFWYGQGATNRYIGQVFLSPIKVEEISVDCRNQTTSNTPATAEIQYSDDGVTWTNQKSLTFGTWVTNTPQVLAAI